MKNSLCITTLVLILSNLIICSIACSNISTIKEENKKKASITTTNKNTKKINTNKPFDFDKTGKKT